MPYKTRNIVFLAQLMIIIKNTKIVLAIIAKLN